ncbi:RTC4-like domain-containing protein, partial [Mycena vulgaris]
IDPRTLCPYCDSLLPTRPTPFLTQLLDQTFSRSYPDPWPVNRLGRTAQSIVFAAVCHRHALESETIPEAEAQGWPTNINWEALKVRVLEMENDLEQILADRDDEEKETQRYEFQPESEKTPRMRCVFWEDLLRALKAEGPKSVKGLQAQFTNFEKTQPGYYGEQGAVIIHQILYDMFPLGTIDPDLVRPFTPNEFILRILVPEVGMRLIIQDMSLSVDSRLDKRRAVAVLRASARYGVAMFPVDGGD